MCYLMAKTGKNNPVENAICVGGFPQNTAYVKFYNKLIQDRDESIVDWIEVVEDAFEIKCEDGWWNVRHLNRPQQHLAVLLVRQTIEREYYDDKIRDAVKYGGSKAVNPLKAEGDDPLEKFLNYTAQGKFERDTVHGLQRMAKMMEYFNIPFSRVSLKKAVSDLKKSKLMINDAWSSNVRIGLVP